MGTEHEYPYTPLTDAKKGSMDGLQRLDRVIITYLGADSTGSSLNLLRGRSRGKNMGSAMKILSCILEASIAEVCTVFSFEFPCRRLQIEQVLDQNI
jgi:hypothetical protein